MKNSPRQKIPCEKSSRRICTLNAKLSSQRESITNNDNEEKKEFWNILSIFQNKGGIYDLEYPIVFILALFLLCFRG